ncbi:hypothetical protein AGDE_08483 [Angomonas deanei]|nr:hypothetical protein AGDE_08483 [Angomonas deanei]|eukprot:EPY32843.1 hypothetical protein AGDE_08483 [Angomonas deanei]
MDGSGVQRYRPGVLVGNWYEEQQSKEDQVALYRAQRAKAESQGPGMASTRGGGGATSLEMTKSFLTQPAALSDDKTGPVRFGQPLLVVNKKTGSTLALDLAASNGGNLSAVPGKTPQVRNTWVLQRAQDADNKAFNSLIKEPDVLHYGQRVRIANEDASEVGFLYVHSELASGLGSSQGQSACVRYGASTDNIFVVVKPNLPRGQVLDGDPVQLGDSVGLIHSITNLPLCLGGQTHRTTFGVEPKITCEYALENRSRSKAAIVAKEENMFFFAADGDGAAPIAARSTRSLNRSATTKSAQEEKVEELMHHVREKVLLHGGRLGFRTISRALGVSTKEHRTTYVSRQQLTSLLTQAGLRLSPGEIDIVMKKCDHDGDTRVSAQELLSELRGNMPPERMRAVSLAYQALVVEGHGAVEFIDMYNIYRVNAHQHPDVLDGLLSAEELIFDFENSWPGRVTTKIGTVTQNEFVEYYNDISPVYSDDERFMAIVSSSWDIPATDAYRSGQPLRSITVTQWMTPRRRCCCRTRW